MKRKKLESNVVSALSRAIEAIDFEIEAVREKPASESLSDGKKLERKTEHIYEFEYQSAGLRFAEHPTAFVNGEEITVEIADIIDKKVHLLFPKNMGEHIPMMFLEWENDFVLQKLKSELLTLSQKPDCLPRLSCLLNPAEEFSSNEEDIHTVIPDFLNPSQARSIKKALSGNINFIWGPPGTGKTSTLGYIIANLLNQGKHVLFVSNTNRAVDVGLLDTVEALKQTGQAGLLKNVTRFGESAIEDPELEPLLFEAIIAKKMEKKKEKASALAALLSNFDTRQKQADELMAQGKAVPEALDLECMMFGAKIDKEGGRDKIEASIEKLTQANERLELLAKNLVATTLAKVCTSDLFNGMMFDAVVVDEASMAGLPYLLVMAAKSTQHLVLVGDPMQLPPISITSEKTAAEFLEADIFTYISGATSTAELFKWHDQHPEFTSFFDVQYRLGSDLASVISSVFYEGRLKTTDEKQSADSVAFIDTSRYRAYIISKESKYGFHPVNDVHLRILAESIRKLLQRNNAADIGVIVPFRNCVYGHRAYLRSQGISDVEIGTIHTFQGREKPVIIFDTVMSADKTNNFPRHFSVRPFDEIKNGLSVPRLLNVACSRSRDKLVVLADMNHVEAVYSDKFFGNLMRALQRHSISVSD